jgi:hypothetical protein
VKHFITRTFYSSDWEIKHPDIIMREAYERTKKKYKKVGSPFYVGEVWSKKRKQIGHKWEWVIFEF